MLFTLLAIVGIFIIFALIILGSIIGLIIGLGILIILFGVANNIIADLIWGFSMNWSILSLLLHGLVLFIGLLIVNFAVIILPQIAFPGIITTIVTFVPGCIADGIVAKHIAEYWTENEQSENDGKTVQI